MNEIEKNHFSKLRDILLDVKEGRITKEEATKRGHALIDEIDSMAL